MVNRNLPPPIRPNTRSSREETEYSRASLSDFSDYESSDEGTYEAAAQSSSSKAHKPYVSVSDNDLDEVEEEDARRHISEDEDPFADPFGD
jgi:LAS seventeen-binding protein 5